MPGIWCVLILCQNPHSLHFQRISFFFKCPHLQPESSIISIIHSISDLALWKSTKRKLSKCFICLQYGRHGFQSAHNGGIPRPDVRAMPSDSLNLLRLSSFTCGDPRMSSSVGLLPPTQKNLVKSHRCFRHTKVIQVSSNFPTLASRLAGSSLHSEAVLDDRCYATVGSRPLGFFLAPSVELWPVHR